MRLLIVEDEKKLCNIVANQMKDAGYSVDKCNDGLEAIDYIESTEYDAIILDIMLPGMDGISILKKIRAAKRHTPVLLLTCCWPASRRPWSCRCTRW